MSDASAQETNRAEVVTMMGVTTGERMAASIRPHPSWFSIAHAYGPGSVTNHQVTSRECLGIFLHANARVRSIVDGRETVHDVRQGMVGIVPPDRKRHVVVVSAPTPTTAFTLLIPAATLGVVLREGMVRGDADMACHMAFHDDGIRELLVRLRDGAAADVASADSSDALVRDLILRAVHCCTGQAVDRAHDALGFDGAGMRQLNDMIDASLTVPPRLADIALATGYSSSHCARKIRHATGMSLDRLCNHRRIRAALRILCIESVPLAGLSIDLGFSSQSHFTRVFRAVTGMTPAKYAGGFRRKAV